LNEHDTQKNFWGMGLTYFRSNRKHLVAKFKIGPRRASEAVAK